MTLDTKLIVLEQKPWTRQLALECWSRYDELYFNKYGGLLHVAMINGNSDKYIERELKVFQRYAQMFIYQRTKPVLYDIHHVAQENKLKRLQHGCDK